MLQNKRGLSAIISVVLLISFTVVLFLLISSWIRGSIIDESLSDTEEKLAGQLDCLSTNVEISNVQVKTDGTEVKLNVDNSGDTSITGLRIRVMHTVSGDLTLIEYPESGTINVAPLARILTTSAPIAMGPPIVGANRVEVYPVLSSGQCNDQFDSTTNIGSYS